MSAMGFVMTSETSSHYNGRITTFVVLSCAMAAMGGLLFGYDIGISGSDQVSLIFDGKPSTQAIRLRSRNGCVLQLFLIEIRQVIDRCSQLGGVTSMASFLEKFFPDVYKKMREDTKISNYCKFDSQLLTAFTSSFYIAGLFAALFASSITKALGRRASILTGSVSFLAGTALGAAAFDVRMLIFGRVFLGIGVGFSNQVLLA
ncbi:hypothetical protein ACLOJK_005637 [Asimina triloba]